MWTTVARTKRRGDQKIPAPTSFGSAPPLSASEFGAFRHGFFYSVLKNLFLSTVFIVLPSHQYGGEQGQEIDGQHDTKEIGSGFLVRARLIYNQKGFTIIL
jgi:hypothetical protein